MSAENPLPPGVTEGEKLFTAPNDVRDVTTQAHEIEKLFNHCFEMSHIDEGAEVPAGGRMDGSLSMFVIADFDKFADFFAEIHSRSDALILSKIKEWLLEQQTDFDVKIFAKLFAFTKEYAKKYSFLQNDKRGDTRMKMYFAQNSAPKLSDFFTNNSAECVEIATLAQGFLQQEGVGSSFFSGEKLESRDHGEAGAHSLLILRIEGRIFLYDPTNPTITTEMGIMPSVFKVSVDFDKIVRQGKQLYVECENILSKKKELFGVGAMRPFKEDQIVS